MIYAKDLLELIDEGIDCEVVPKYRDVIGCTGFCIEVLPRQVWKMQTIQGQSTVKLTHKIYTIWLNKKLVNKYFKIKEV